MNTIILAAGSADFKSMPIGFTASQLMLIINGKPVISWVLNIFLKNTTQNITIALKESDTDLLNFINKIYLKNKRVELCLVKQSHSILDSCLAAVNCIKKKKNFDIKSAIRIMLADTLLLNTRFISGDYIYVSKCKDLSEKWCLVETDNHGNVVSFFNKCTSLDTNKYKISVGRYEFSNLNLLENALNEAICLNKKELSDVIEIYSQKIDKPFKTIDIPLKDWIDFGHLEGIAKAKKQLMESRSFNSIEISTPVPLLIKKSVNKKKLEKEFLWYQSLPNELKVLAPNVIEHNVYKEYSEIKMEYYGYSTLTEKFVYASLPPSYWLSVINNLFKLISEFKKIECPISKSSFQKHAITMYSDKTFQRINQLKEQKLLWARFLDNDYLVINGRQYKNVNLLKNFIKDKSEVISNSIELSFIHGDLCFNNILYDARCGIIKLIDPRGEFGSLNTNFGDIRYDIAKIKHSFCGGYDHIVEGHFELSRKKNGYIIFTIPNININENEKIFADILNENGVDLKVIDFIEALLFISMTPLHDDSLKKQIALFIQGIIKLNDCLDTWETQ